MNDTTPPATAGTLVAQVHLDHAPTLGAPIATLGLHGEVEAISCCLRHAGIDAPIDEVMGVTASAFRTHFFRPDDNPGMHVGPNPDDPNAIWGPRYAWTSLQHNNYGHVESASHFFNAEIRDVRDLDPLTTWKLLRFELDDERPLFAVFGDDPLKVELVVGYRLEKSPLRQWVLVQGEDGLKRVDLTGRDPRKRPDGLPWPHTIWLVRPAAAKPYRSSDDTQRVAALRWSLAHARKRRELVYESSRFYAVGLRAFTAFAEFLTDLVPQELAEPIEQSAEEAAEDIDRYCLETLRAWRDARVMAARYLTRWSQSLRDDPRQVEGLGDDPALALEPLPPRYQATADRLAQLVEAFEGKPLSADRDARAALALGLREAQALEEAAVTALAHALS